MLYADGFYEYHGRIDLTWIYWYQLFAGGRAPEYIYNLQKRIMVLISRVVMASCYWFGRLILGMKGRYPQYTPRPGIGGAIDTDGKSA